MLKPLPERRDILEHRDDGGEAREAHEQEEQRAPDAAASHVHEDVGQGLPELTIARSTR